jgi:hypothetical protein
LQATLHLPAWHLGAPLGVLGQVLPQLPQFWVSLSRRMQALPHWL